jgi:hypothetical protein
MLDFQKVLAEKLIYIDYLVQESKESPEGRSQNSRSMGVEEHELLTLPKKHKFLKNLIVCSVADHPQGKCFLCGRKVQTYCRCSPGTQRCSNCFAKHYAAVDI